MSFYDILMFVVFAGAILFGLWKGLAWQIASLAAIFISYVVAMQFRGQVSDLIQAPAPWNMFGAMLILYLGTSFIIWVVFGYIRRSIERFHLKEFDRQAGAILGAIKGALLCMVITMFAVTLADERVRSAVVTSKSGNFLARSINQLSAVVPKELHDVLNPMLNQFNQKASQPPTFPAGTQTGGGGAMAGGGENGSGSGGWNPWGNQQASQAGGQASGQSGSQANGSGAGGQGGGLFNWNWQAPRNPNEVQGSFGSPRRSAGQGPETSGQPR
jgi:membrane protein required for colicin V production